MTSNVTLRMDSRLLKELRHCAVDANQSLSAWITSVLEEKIQSDKRFASARKRALKKLEDGLKLGGKPLSREEVHAR